MACLCMSVPGCCSECTSCSQCTQPAQMSCENDQDKLKRHYIYMPRSKQKMTILCRMALMNFNEFHSTAGIFELPFLLQMRFI
jgi:hypothetical protein